MIASRWFKRLKIALEFDSGFEIFLLLGRAEFARPALTRVASELRSFGAPRWHQLHLDGLDSLLATEQPRGLLHLVHGFERMPAPRASELAARLNLNRDRLEFLAGPVIFWVAEDFYEELLRQAPDFIAWRSQASVVPEAELDVPPEVFAGELLSCSTQLELDETCRALPPVDIMAGHGRKPVLNWLAEGRARQLAYTIGDHPLRVTQWCAWQLARLRDGGHYEQVPVLLPSLLLLLADARDETYAGLGPNFVEGLDRLWVAGVLQVIITVPLTAAEWSSIEAQLGDNHLLGAVMDPGPEAGTIASLTNRQLEVMIERSFADLDRREQVAWRELMVETEQQFGDRLRRVGVLTNVISYWRHLGSSSVRSGLSLRGWREHSFWVAMSSEVHSKPDRVSGSLTFEYQRLAQDHVLARTLCEFGKRTGGVTFLQRSIALYGSEQWASPPVEFVDALLVLAETYESDLELESELQMWREALVAARAVTPPEVEFVIRALDGLGSLLLLAERHDEAQEVVGEAIALTREVGSGVARLAELLSVRGRVLRAQGQLEQALGVAEEALNLLDEGAAGETQGLLFELWNLCDECYSELGMAVLARAAARQSIEVRRRVAASIWPSELLAWTHRLLMEGALEDALEAATEAAQLCARQHQEAPYNTYAQSLTLLAKVHWALDQPGEAIAGAYEAVRVYRAVIDDGGPSWSMAELVQTLLLLASYLDEIEPEGVVDVLLQATRMLEEQFERYSGQYPADFVEALRRLGDASSSRQMDALAAGAYARILQLAEPFPARHSERIREIALWLADIERRSGIHRGQALTRYRERLSV